MNHLAGSFNRQYSDSSMVGMPFTIPIQTGFRLSLYFVQDFGFVIFRNVLEKVIRKHH